MTGATDSGTPETSVAAWVARFLRERGVARVFGLHGGHIQPIWDWLGRLGVPIVDVRHESAAVHMAQAHAEIVGGFGVALATAGPGVTNCVTGIVNASLARTPLLLIGGCAQRLQANMGAFQDVPHVEILRPITRSARTLRVADQVLRELDEAVARAMGDGGEPGPVYLELPIDLLRETVPAALAQAEWRAPKPPRILHPDPASVAAAADALRAARRPLVISGRGARGASQALVRLLDASGALYIDTQESRGLVPPDHPSFVGAARGRAMTEADLVVVVGRKLDYQLGYGSPAVFPEARFVRIAETAAELVDNRRGDPEVMATPAVALDALAAALLAAGTPPGLDTTWTSGLRAVHLERSAFGPGAPAVERDGRIHPSAIFEAIRQIAEPDCVAIADGGDILSFARVGFSRAQTYLDSGTLGCLGVGVPFAVAAALACPERQVICVSGDGAFGMNALEIDTAVRHGARAVVVVANNAAWNIERLDQEMNYGGRVIGTELRSSDYAGLARAMGAHGERVEAPDQLAPALARALAQAPAVVDVVTSRLAVSSDVRKGLGALPDYQALPAWNAIEEHRRAGR